MSVMSVHLKYSKNYLGRGALGGWGPAPRGLVLIRRLRRRTRGRRRCSRRCPRRPRRARTMRSETRGICDRVVCNKIDINERLIYYCPLKKLGLPNNCMRKNANTDSCSANLFRYKIDLHVKYWFVTVENSAFTLIKEASVSVSFNILLCHHFFFNEMTVWRWRTL